MDTKVIMEKGLFFSRTADFLDVFLVKQCNKSQKTRESYRDALTVFKRYTEETGYTVMTFHYTDCTYEYLLDYKAYLSEQKHYKASSINQRIAAVKSYLKYSYGCDSMLIQIYIGASGIPPSKVPKIQRETLKENEIGMLLDSPPATKKGLRDSLIMSLLFDTAIRLDELIRLKLGDIYKKSGYSSLLIHGKGHKERKVSLDHKTEQLLDIYLKEFHQGSTDPERPLIYTVIKGDVKHMSHRNVQKLLKKYGERAKSNVEGLPDSVHPHLLRRSRACDLYQNGTPLEIVSRFLGHSSIETTKDHYAFPSMEQMRSAIHPSSDKDTEEPLWKGHEDKLARMCGLR